MAESSAHRPSSSSSYLQAIAVILVLAGGVLILVSGFRAGMRFALTLVGGFLPNFVFKTALHVTMND